MNYSEFLKRFQKREVIVHQDIVERQPMVSVCVQTYQHFNYIKECLDGILMQQTTFPFEILLGEDSGTDGTREICMEYAQKHPDKVRIFLHHRENNISINGTPTGRFNFLYNLYNARGKYIALCEGDDYWTDPLKLQKQVNFLEGNDEYVICFHKVKVNYKNHLSDDTINEKRFQKIDDFPVKLNHLLEIGNFISTPSVVFRNTLKTFPEKFLLSPVGDYFLYIFLLHQKGFIKRMEETMAVYRSGVGVFSSRDNITMNAAMLKSQICILGFIENPKQKELVLKRTLLLMDNHNKIISSNDINRKIAARKGFLDLFKMIVFKLVSILKK